jgi:hypothetical protein
MARKGMLPSFPDVLLMDDPGGVAALECHIVIVGIAFDDVPELMFSRS